MATGAFARSSQSQPSIQSQLSTASFPSSQASTPLSHNRIKSRRRPIKDGEIEESKSKRSNKAEDIESEAFGLLISTLKAQASDQGQGSSKSKVKRVRLNTFELAIRLLQDEYGLRLSDSHFLVAVEYLESQSKASIFITLEGQRRDQWLRGGAKIELLSNVNNELNI